MRMRKTVLFMLLLVISVGSLPSIDGGEVTVAYGEQIVLTLRNDGLVDCVNTLLITASNETTGNLHETLSIDGEFVGNLTYECTDPSRITVDYGVVNGISVININITNVTLLPSKFWFVRMSYTLDRVLKPTEQGWHFKTVFTGTGGSMEIVVKVPKASSEFEEVRFHNVVPIPHAFYEEGTHHVFTWKSPVFSYDEKNEYYVEVAYTTVFRWIYFAIFILGAVVGAIITIIVENLLGRIWSSILKLLKRGKSVVFNLNIWKTSTILMLFILLLIFASIGYSIFAQIPIFPFMRIEMNIRIDSVISLISTVALVFLTAWYTYLTHKTLEVMKKSMEVQNRPVLTTIFLQSRENKGGISLEAKNISEKMESRYKSRFEEQPERLYLNLRVKNEGKGKAPFLALGYRIVTKTLDNKELSGRGSFFLPSGTVIEPKKEIEISVLDMTYIPQVEIKDLDLAYIDFYGNEYRGIFGHGGIALLNRTFYP